MKTKHDHKFNIACDGLVVEGSDDEETALIIYADYAKVITGVSIVNSVNKDITDVVVNAGY